MVDECYLHFIECDLDISRYRQSIYFPISFEHKYLIDYFLFGILFEILNCALILSPLNCDCERNDQCWTITSDGCVENYVVYLVLLHYGLRIEMKKTAYFDQCGWVFAASFKMLFYYHDPRSMACRKHIFQLWNLFSIKNKIKLRAPGRKHVISINKSWIW